VLFLIVAPGVDVRGLRHPDHACDLVFHLDAATDAGRRR
jgi:hypothetical protein